MIYIKDKNYNYSILYNFFYSYNIFKKKSYNSCNFRTGIETSTHLIKQNIVLK